MQKSTMCQYKKTDVQVSNNEQTLWCSCRNKSNLTIVFREIDIIWNLDDVELEKFCQFSKYFSNSFGRNKEKWISDKVAEIVVHI